MGVLIIIFIALLLVVIVLLLLNKKKGSSSGKKRKSSLSKSEIVQLAKISRTNIHTKMMDLFKERFKDVKPLSAGGMGYIVQGIDRKTSQKVAIKTVLPEHEQNRRVQNLFMDEYKAIQKMNHPNIVRLYDAGQSGNIYYYIMELLEGENLKNKLIREKQFSVEYSIVIGLKVIRALQHCHDNKIIHRDIKPSNIFITDSSQVKIIDFGLVKFIAKGLSEVKGTTYVGTPEFASPEQIQGRMISGRSDIYAFGICLFLMMTGRMPFKSETITSRLFEEPMRLSSILKNIPEEVDEIVWKTMNPDPKQRPAAAKVWAVLKSIPIKTGGAWDHLK